MSCGQPHAVDCAAVLERVYDYLDGELDDLSHEEIRNHLDECSPCLRQFGLEHAVKLVVARSCACAPAPDHLRTAVLVRLQQIRLTTTTVQFRVE